MSCATTNHLFVSAPYIRELAEETIYIKKKKVMKIINTENAG